MTWRLGLDVGTNSLGWAVIRLDSEGRPASLADTGVRIFSDGRDPQDKQSLAAKRREPRGARRNRDRYLKRRGEFMERLITHGLMPADETARKELERLDPWELRVRGLDEKLSLHEFGRALFHLQQRRGFKSNRKTDSGDDDKGKIKTAAEQVAKRMCAEGARTLAELLARPRLEDPDKARTTSVRARLSGAGAKAFYDFYPTRPMIEDEFDELWKKQKAFHAEALSDTACGELRDTLLFQRDLKPQPVGKCTLDPSEERAPRALPSVQRYRIYHDVNHLRLRRTGQAERKLTLEERDKIAAKLLSTSSDQKFDTLTRLTGAPEARFNLQSEKRKAMKGDEAANILAAGPGKKSCGRWGKAWRDVPLEKQDAIVEILIGQGPYLAKDKPNPIFESIAQTVAKALGMAVERTRSLLASNSGEEIADWLATDFGLAPDCAEAVANASLPAGHGNLGRTATQRVLRWLAGDEKEAADPETGQVYTAPFTYNEAVRLAGYHSHSEVDDFEGDGSPLPYYGAALERHVAFGTGEPHDPTEKRLGKIANPTVHVALNQIRKVVNALMKRHGAPKEIVVELARDLPLSAKGKNELEREQKANQDANEARAEELARYNQRNTYDNRLRLRLWEELNPDNPLNRCCVYTGEKIGREKLFTDAVEIEHILPFSQTLDDSFGNKTLSMRRANRDKGQRSPYDAFGNSPAGYDWNAITERAANLPNNKAWRFGPDAMARYQDEETGFLARQLNENRYIARLAKTYLRRTGADVWVTPGWLTADLRWAWGLDSVLAGHNLQEAADPKKNRNDHRHHAIDAVVVGLTDRALVQAVATAAGKAEDKFERNWLKEFPEPWPGFRETVQESIGHIVVSHKADHGLQGELHEGTNYGVVADPKTGEPRLASRKALAGLTENEVANIGDLKIREDLQYRLSELAELRLDAKERKKAVARVLEEYGRDNNIRRVRVHKVEAAYEVIRHNGHEKAVIPGENHCVDIVETPDGTWRGVGVTRFEANRQKRLGAKTPLWKEQYQDARHIMRVHKNDLLMLEKDGREQVMRVVKLQPSSSTFALAAHDAAGTLQKRHDAKDDAFRWDFANFGKLKERRARLVHVDPAGKLHDPGPPR